MHIDKIQKLKNDKYKITIDGDPVITFDNVILENNILYRTIIDKELYEKIIDDTKYYDVYNKTVKYILKRRRSEKSIINYLSNLEVSENDINDIVIKLKNNNLINDIDYCKAYINDSIYLSKKGIIKIKNELLKEGISIDVINNELDNIDTYELDNKMEKIIIKKIHLNKKYSNTYLKQKILNDMIDLGYNKNDVLKILDDNLTDDSIILKTEFENNYIKLSRKYSGEELIKKLKNKLLMKGFNIYHINDLLKEKTEE